MDFNSPLQSARLIKRYKRFLADVITPEGQTLTIHCANTGAMTGCAEPGDTVWYSTSANPKRKYAHSWELTETQAGDWICVNTLRANAVIKEALEAQKIAELTGYQSLKSEVGYGNENSRIDFLLPGENRPDRYMPDCYIEVKSVTLFDGGSGYFPDAVTLRGQKHLRELEQMVKQGKRSILCFAVLHSAITQVSVAEHIDQRYAELLKEVQQNGVEILCYNATISPIAMKLKSRLPFIM